MAKPPTISQTYLIGSIPTFLNNIFFTQIFSSKHIYYTKGTQNFFPATQLTTVLETWPQYSNNIISTFFVFKSRANNFIFVYKPEQKISTFLPAMFILSFSTKEKHTLQQNYSQKILQIIFSKKFSPPPQIRRQPVSSTKNITFRDQLQIVPYLHLIK